MAFPFGDMADLSTTNSAGKGYDIPTYGDMNFRPMRDGNGTMKGLTDPSHYHYDGSQRVTQQPLYAPSNNTLTPIGLRGFDQDFTPDGRQIYRALPRHINDSPSASFYNYDENIPYGRQGSLTLADPSSPGLLDHSLIDERSYRQTITHLSYQNANHDLSTVSNNSAQRILPVYDDGNIWSSLPPSSPFSVSSAPGSPDAGNSRTQITTLKVANPRSRARNTPRHLQHQYLDTLLRAKFPKDRLMALNMAIKFRDEHAPTDPIPNELLDQLLDGPVEDKFYCFCCPKARKARTITPARDHVRKSLGNFPFQCANGWCRHTSLRQADLNKHMKTCCPPANQNW